MTPKRPAINLSWFFLIYLRKKKNREEVSSNRIIIVIFREMELVISDLCFMCKH